MTKKYEDFLNALESLYNEHEVILETSCNIRVEI